MAGKIRHDSTKLQCTKR
ncbi:hypothetical protein VCHC52A1_2904, partial [Vibrio cholerae HC-52A1]